MSAQPPKSPLPGAKAQFCDYCGAELGVFAHSRRLDGPLTCGERACNREAREDERDLRQEVHDALDRENGWDRW